MKRFQYSVMGHGILLRSLGWATKIFGEISFSPPAHPSSYLMTLNKTSPKLRWRDIQCSKPSRYYLLAISSFSYSRKLE